jgi:alpha-D-xyloside xylohydrolase
MGPYLQYATEKPADNLEIRIYPGADGSFTLYEDENDSYNYEKGAFSTISLMWNDAKKQLIIGDRKGTYPGMLNKRTFNISIVRPNVSTGVDINSKPDKTIEYSGSATIVQL